MAPGRTRPCICPSSITSPSKSLKDPLVRGSKRYAVHFTNSTPGIDLCPPFSIARRIIASRKRETLPLKDNGLMRDFFRRKQAIHYILGGNVPDDKNFKKSIIEFRVWRLKCIFSSMRNLRSPE